MPDYQDRELVCVDGGETFTFTARDQDFFAKKGFQDPKRCAKHRAIKKQQSGFGNRGGGGRREDFNR